MKTLLEHHTLQLLTRLVLGGIFVFSGIEKAVDPSAFAALIDNYRLVPHWFALFAASTLPWAELVCGIALLLGTGTRGAALLLGMLTAIFTVAVAISLARGLDISCGCFTLDPDAGRIGWRKLVENAGLLVLSLFLVYSTGSRWTLAGMIDAGKDDDAR